MRMWQLVSVTVAVVLILSPLAEANGKSGSARTGASAYDASLECKQVYKGRKPVCDVIEDGLAYILDIPLAMLSPVTCPIVAPLREWWDSDGSKTYPPCRLR